MIKRIDWIDIAKGIGIILVILGHLPIPMSIRNYVYSFHMPLFFFLSGYLFSFNKYDNYLEFLKNKIKTIIIPYIFFSSLSYFFWLLILRKYGTEIYSNINPFIPIFGTFYSVGVNDWLIHNGPLWFLTCLFVVENIFYLLKKYNDNWYKLLLSLTLLSIIGFLYSKNISFRLPWSVDVSFIAIGFFGIANIIKNNEFSLKNRYSKMILFLVFLFSSLFFHYLNGRIDMNGNYYNNYFYFYITSFSGIIVSILFSQLISYNSVLSYIGKNSLIIYGTHKICIKIIRGVQRFLFNIPIEITNNSILWGVIYTLGVIVMNFLLIQTFNRFFPTKRHSNKFISY